MHYGTFCDIIIIINIKEGRELIVNINDFFDFDNKEPINRIAYTEEDAKYKLKCMKVMQDIGMQIFIDDFRKYCTENI